jgi:hypothetical protein
MTNAEKFEEVFGYKISDFPVDPCDIISRVCALHTCPSCPLFHFWEKEYTREENVKYEDD